MPYSPRLDAESRSLIPSQAVRQAFIDLLREGYCIRSPARADSMAPFIRKGDLLTVKPVTLAEVRMGDIVAWRREEAESVLTTHRVVQKGRDREGAFVITKGDRSHFRDLPLRCPEHVYGRIISLERNGRPVSLETAFQRLLGYLRARLSLGRWALSRAMAAPHLVPGWLVRRIWRLCLEASQELS